MWILPADYRKTHKKCDDNFIITDITELGEITDGYLVTNEVAALIKETPAKFKISDGAVVELSDEEYAEYLEEVEAERIANLSLTAADVERAIYKAKGSKTNIKLTRQFKQKHDTPPPTRARHVM